MKKYFLIENGSSKGPFSLTELNNLKLKSDTLIWSNGMSAWTKLSEIPELNDELLGKPPIFKDEEKADIPPPFNNKSNIGNSDLKDKKNVVGNNVTSNNNAPTSKKTNEFITYFLVALFILIGIIYYNDYKNKEEKRQAQIEAENARIEAERLEAERIKEEERQNRLSEEDKNKKLVDAEQQINTFTVNFMNRVSPATGKNPTYKIITEESTYDKLTKTLSVVFESSWEAVPDFSFSPSQTHTHKGRLTIYGTGEVQQETLYQNDVLIKAIKSTANAETVIDWLNKNSKKTD